MPSCPLAATPARQVAAAQNSCDAGTPKPSKAWRSHCSCTIGSPGLANPPATLSRRSSLCGWKGHGAAGPFHPQAKVALAIGIGAAPARRTQEAM